MAADSVTGSRRWIDVHAHVVPMRVVEVLRRNPGPYGVSVEGSDARLTFTLGPRRIGQPTFAELVDEARFLEAQQTRIERGLAGEVVSIWPELGSYELPPPQGRAWSRLYNEELARFIGDQPASLQLAGLGIVPLQDPEGAVQELEHAVQACRLRGVLVVANPPNVSLEGEALEPFWSRAEALGATVFVHPNIGFGPGQDQPYFLGVIVGAPVDTTFTAARLIASGLLDRHPRLNLLLAHGGGFLPFQAGRLAYVVRRDGRGGDLGFRCERPVEDYLPFFYYDTLLYDPAIVRRLAEQVGAARLMAGSDFPFPTYEEETLDTILAAGLPESAVRDILYGTAARLFGLDLARITR